MTKEEQFVRDELGRVYPQLIKNAQRVCGNAFDKHGMDLLSVCVEFFLNKPLEDQLQTIEIGKLENFITYMMNVQLKSNSSKFYKEYREASNNSVEYFSNYDYGNNDQEDPMIEYENRQEYETLVDCIYSAMADFTPYEKMLVKERVIEGNTFKSISDKYDINYLSLKRTTYKALKVIKERCSHLKSTY